MNKINIIGDIFGSSGYSSHTRQLANSFHEQGCDVRIDCNKPQSWELMVNDAELLMLQKPFDEEMTTIMIGQPPFWRLGIADNPKKFIGFLVWEGDTIPEYWIEYLVDERVDQIWVPSKHVKRAICNTYKDRRGQFIINKIKIVPHGVDLCIFKHLPTKEKRPFTFIINKGWRGGMEDRGGVQYALKAFTEEFTKKDDVRLVVKLNPAYLSPGFDFTKELKNIGIEKNKNLPEIKFSFGEVAYKSIGDFYNEGDVFVNATRAEGFGLTGIEAKACGLPTIQTGFGGQLDYMDEGVDFKIDYELVEITHDMAYEGIKWAIPDIKHLKEIMRHCYENQEEVKELADMRLPYIREWTWRESAKKGMNALKELQ